MSELSPPVRAKRPEFRNINAFNDLPGYRWPLAAIVSGMHRARFGFVPGILVKIVALGLIWAYLHHFFAGMRHIRMDMFHTVSKVQGKTTAQIVLVLSLGLTLVLGAKLFGLY